MKKISLVHLIFILSFQISNTLAQHTFSIVAVDSVTKEVGGAGASCVNGSISVSIINGLIPRRGGIHAQASVCVPNTNLQNGLKWMKNGNSPQEILDSLLSKDVCTWNDYRFRQYGIVDFDSVGKPRSVGYSGANCMDYKNHISRFNYSIQGNILLGQEILDSIEARFLNANGTLADRLMEALQGANVIGADTRCLSNGTSSLSAFIRVAKPGDSSNNIYLNLDVNNILDGIEPIDSLEKLYENWKMSNSVYTIQKNIFELSIYPNPASEKINFELIRNENKDFNLKIINVLGEIVCSQQFFNNKASIVTNNLSKGFYFYKISGKTGMIQFGKIILQ